MTGYNGAVANDHQDSQSNETEAMAQKMLRAGIPADEVQAFRSSFVPKGDVTRLRQRDAEEMQRFRAELDQMKRAFAASHPAEPSVDPLIKDLQELGYDTSKDQKLIEVLKKSRDNSVTMAEQRIIQKLAPVFNPMLENDHLSKLENALVERYGDKARNAWGSVKEEARNLIKQGYAVNPFVLLQEKNEDAFVDLVSARHNESRKTQTQTARQTSGEGFTRQVASQPMATPANADNHEAGNEWKPVDYAALVANVSQELGISETA